MKVAIACLFALIAGSSAGNLRSDDLQELDTIGPITLHPDASSNPADADEDVPGLQIFKKHHKKKSENDENMEIHQLDVIIDIDNVINTEDRDLLQEADIVDQAVKDAYNEVHKDSGFEVLFVKALREMDAPISPPEDDSPGMLGQTKGKPWNGWRTYSQYSTSINWGCRFCPPNTSGPRTTPHAGPTDPCPWRFPIDEFIACYRRSKGLLPPAVLAMVATAKPHEEFEKLFCKMLVDSGLPQFVKADNCKVLYIQGDTDLVELSQAVARLE
jgi:hypothetical protein